METTREGQAGVAPAQVEFRQSRAAAGGPGSDRVEASEASVRPSSDLGNLLAKSQNALGSSSQKRTPIVTDPRVRGTHTGQLQASGSYWVPARQDLDTMTSKIDSGIIRDVLTVKGPYSVRYGPGFSFFDIAIQDSPRFENGPEWHGRTRLNYQTNGEQWYGRQTLFGGSADWGLRVGYGHRTGNDYETGDGDEIPSSYKSRDIDAALGLDLSCDSRIEFGLLRLDQADVEFPGQIFDMDSLVTDGFELKYVLENQCHFDQLQFETWYNRTRFEGNAQRSGKRRQIPQLEPPPVGILDFTGFTDVDSMSTGYRLAVTWGLPDNPQLTAGADLRYIEQELNEIDSFDPIAGGSGAFANFPIPRSHSSNPGLFVEQTLPVSEAMSIKAGARVDWVSANREGETFGRSDSDLAFILGTDDFDRDFQLWSVYLTAEYELDCHWTATGGLGHGERPPTLTELYAIDPFLAILQQGFTQVRGQPRLDPERLWQMDLGLRGQYERFRGGIHGFYAWVHDYITYEAIDTSLSNAGLGGGLGVQFTNTELATLSGGEVYGEYDVCPWATTFGTLSYVEGRDHTRGDRGLIPGSREEPLAGIAPLESRIGVRLQQEALRQPADRQTAEQREAAQPRYGIELAARIVNNQDRVATSLLEQETAGFTTYDVRGFWHATDSLLLVAGVENLTDKHYREHLDLRTGTGVFQPGVGFYFGMELNY